MHPKGGGSGVRTLRVDINGLPPLDALDTPPEPRRVSVASRRMERCPHHCSCRPASSNNQRQFGGRSCYRDRCQEDATSRNVPCDRAALPGQEAYPVLDRWRASDGRQAQRSTGCKMQIKNAKLNFKIRDEKNVRTVKILTKGPK